MTGKATVAMARNFMRRVLAKYPDAQSVTNLEDAGSPAEMVRSVQVMFTPDTADKVLFLLSLGDGQPPNAHASGENTHVTGRTRAGLPFVVLVPHEVWQEAKAALAGRAMAAAFGVES